MKLIVHELESSDLFQTVTPEKNVIVEAIRPHLYRHRFAEGSLKMEIWTADGDLVAASSPVSIEDLGETDFFHGYVRFDIQAGLKKDVQYEIYLVGDDYEFSEEAYIGWCNGFDLGKYPPDYVPDTNFNYPLDLEIWERSTK